MRETTHGMKQKSVNGPVKNNAYGNPNSFSFFWVASFVARGLFSEIVPLSSVGLPNSVGIKSFTPADLAASARGNWMLMPPIPTAETTTSIPERAVVREDGEE